MLRIAQLANLVSPTSGGMKIAIDQLGAGYLAAGHERLLIIPGAKNREIETESGLLVTIASPKISSVYRLIVRPDKMFDVLNRYRPTNVECSDKWTMTGSAGWARKNNAGCVLFSHERLEDMAADFLGFKFGVAAAARSLHKRLARKFDAVVVTSEYARAGFEGIDGDIRQVPLGVDLRTFSPQAAQDSGGLLRLIYAGRMSHEKYPHLAIGAAVELNRRGFPFELHVYGKGPDLAKMQRLAGDAPVFFHGFLADRNQLATRYSESHIALSVCPTETFGLAVLEALACGTPVVTADRGGASELIDENCGQSGTPTPQGIADALEALAGRLTPELRSNARARAQEYSWDRSAGEMLKIHQELAQRKR